MNGIELIPLTPHNDDRGFFMEILRETNPTFNQFGQWSMSMMHTGVVKAWHIHQIQTDYWFVPPIGKIKAAVCDRRLDSDTFGQVKHFYFGKSHSPALLVIPPGVAHGLRVIDGPAYLFYITSHIYNPDDEGRISIKEIDYAW